MYHCASVYNIITEWWVINDGIKPTVSPSNGNHALDVSQLGLQFEANTKDLTYSIIHLQIRRTSTYAYLKQRKSGLTLTCIYK